MKFLLFLLIILAVWYGMRWLQQAEVSRRLNEQRADDRRAGRKTKRTARAVDTIACPRCGSYVPANNATACNRGDCPFPVS